MSTTSLSTEEVEERLLKFKNLPEIVDELYDFGQTLAKQSIEIIRTVESKALTFAAYGAAVATLLVSSSSTWSNLGNQWTPWIALCSGISALLCTFYSVGALSPEKVKYTSEDEWLKTECLELDPTSQLDTLKRYRIFTMWNVIHSNADVQEKKAGNVQAAQLCLLASVFYLVLLLIHIVFLRSGLSIRFWPRLYSVVHNLPGVAMGQVSDLGGFFCAAILGITALLFVLSLLRRIRLF